MHLVLVISSLRAGGAERVMTTLAGAWAERGHQVELVTTHDGCKPPHYPVSSAVQLRSVDPQLSGLRKQPAIFRALRDLIKTSRPDIVVSFLNYTNIMTLAACRGLGVPVIVSERTDPSINRIGPLWSLLRRILYRSATRLVVQTQASAMRFEVFAPGRVRVVPNPIQLPVSVPERYLPGERASADATAPTVIAIGRLTPVKGFDLALRAMAMLPQELDQWRLVILGEGPSRNELTSLRDQLGLKERVDLLGLVPDPLPWLRRADIFLLSSRSEGFPNALCEAMAAGLSVVAADCPSGPADIITPGVDGLLVPSEDPAAIAAALERLMTSPELRERLAHKAQDVASRYTLDNIMTAWDDILNEVVPRAK
jgi:GalNAc-alpha-(1->4)-GalNAc-alpha-(1->3)-diNAcBac-PP-undecaprenol alpha-1,4-N-acetyl-D-galactosaminyltransferase